MHHFDDLEQVERTLHGLTEWQGQTLVVQLPRTAGTKEPRWAHLFSGEPAVSEGGAPSAPAAGERHDRIAALEAEVAGLRADLEGLRAEFSALKRQLE
jgi:uncharacterized protein YceH (UPF0502 family)